MKEFLDPAAEERRLTRRAVLRRGAIASGAVFAPAIVSFVAPQNAEAHACHCSVGKPLTPDALGIFCNASTLLTEHDGPPTPGECAGWFCYHNHGYACNEIYRFECKGNAVKDTYQWMPVSHRPDPEGQCPLVAKQRRGKRR